MVAYEIKPFVTRHFYNLLDVLNLLNLYNWKLREFLVSWLLCWP
jgi:hypothetical protein